MAGKFNSEGYRDPTAGGALAAVQRQERAARKGYRPLVYICSPYAGNTEKNTKKARRYSRFAARNACIPFTPHLLYPQFLDDQVPAERALAMSMGMVMLRKCDEVWVFGEEVTEGMAAEIEKAERKGMCIRYFTEGLKEV